LGIITTVKLIIFFCNLYFWYFYFFVYIICFVHIVYIVFVYICLCVANKLRRQ